MQFQTADKEGTHKQKAPSTKQLEQQQDGWGGGILIDKVDGHLGYLVKWHIQLEGENANKINIIASISIPMHVQYSLQFICQHYRELINETLDFCKNKSIPSITTE